MGDEKQSTKFRVIEVREIIKGEEYLVITDPKGMLVFRMRDERFDLHQAYPDRCEKGYSTEALPFRHWRGDHQGIPRINKVIRIYAYAQEDQDYGEPWEIYDGGIIDRDEEPIIHIWPECTVWDEDMTERAKACVNACQGIPSEKLPKSFKGVSDTIRTEADETSAHRGHHELKWAADLIIGEEGNDERE